VKELSNVLIKASDAIREAHRVAREAGREDVCQPLREAGWDLANALSRLTPDQNPSDPMVTCSVAARDVTAEFLQKAQTEGAYVRTQNNGDVIVKYRASQLRKAES
jgi:hypothetical protein